MSESASLARRLTGLRTPVKTILVSALFALIVAGDFASGSDITLRALYLLPVALAAWTLGEGVAVAVSIVSVALSLYFDVVGGFMRLHPRFIYSDVVVRMSVYLAVSWTVNRLRGALERLDELATTDTLTGICNRRGFEGIARRELDRARRKRAATSFAQLDIDGFKHVNDSRGHAEGDRVLVAVAQVLRSGRATDVVARLGGDEFVVLLSETGAADAVKAVLRLRVRLAESMRAQGWPVTFSVGLVTFGSPPDSLEAILSVADDLMYQTKRAGKNDVKHLVIDPVVDHVSTHADHA